MKRIKITEKLCKNIDQPVIDIHSPNNAFKVLHYYYTFTIGCKRFHIAESFWSNGLNTYLKLLRMSGYTEKKLLYLTNKVMNEVDIDVKVVSRIMRKVKFNN